ASTLPMTWISTGTSRVEALATVTGTSPPPRRPPPLPLPPGASDFAAVAPEFEQAQKARARIDVRPKTESVRNVFRWPLETGAGSVGIAESTCLATVLIVMLPAGSGNGSN